MSRARDAFLADGAQRWRELALLVPPNQGLRGASPEQISRIAALYRALSADLSRARSLGCSTDVTTHLDSLASRVHNALYQRRRIQRLHPAHLLLHEFPRVLRQSRYFMLIATLALLLPAAVGAIGTYLLPDFATRVLPKEMLEQLADSYAQGFHQRRDAGSDVLMAGFYVNNNVGIALRCFATGIFFGVGSLFFLVYNGLTLGTVAAYVTQHGAGYNLLVFISGHAPFELTAVVIAGTAGLRMGWAVIETHGQSRLASLRQQAPAIAALVVGTATMLLVAAGIEAFWSPSALPSNIKTGFAVVMTLAVALLLVLGGRGSAHNTAP